MKDILRFDFILKQKLPALPRGVSEPPIKLLYSVDQQAEGKHGEASKSEPERITGKSADDANAAEQAE